MLCCWVPCHPVLRIRNISAYIRHSCPFPFRQIQRISCMDAGGLDNNGREYTTADEMWREQTGDLNKKTLWYREGVSYWEVRTLSFPNHFLRIKLHSFFLVRYFQLFVRVGC